MNKNINQQILKYLEELQTNIENLGLDKKLNEFVEGNVLSIPISMKEVLDEFVKKSVMVLKDMDKADIKTLIFDEQELFWESILSVILREINVYNETVYLRSDEMIVLEVIRTMFDSYIVEKNDIVEMENLSSTDVFNISKHLGNIARTQIKNSFSRVYFVKYFSEKYDFSETVNRFLYDTIESNRDKLVHKYIFEQLDYIESRLDDLEV